MYILSLHLKISSSDVQTAREVGVRTEKILHECWVLRVKFNRLTLLLFITPSAQIQIQVL